MEKIIIGFLIGWMVSSFTPLQEILTKIKDKISDKYFVVFYLKTAVSCHMCLSFWITLFLYQDIMIAIAASFLAFVFDYLIKPNLK